MKWPARFIPLAMMVLVSPALAVTQTQLTTTGYDFEPRFSPSSDDVLYAAIHIQTVPATGGAPTLAVDHEGSYSPAWFPDGQRIVYNNQSEGNELFVKEIDGTIRQLTFNEGRDDDPAVSLDSEWIYFVRDKFEDGQIWRIRSDGSGQEPVIADAGSQLTPSISPDGTTLYYSSNQSGSYQIWQADLTGGNRTQVTPENGYHKFSPSLSPMGTQLVFTSDAAALSPNGTDLGVWLCNPDGSGQVKITPEPPGYCSNASWSKDGSMIVFQACQTTCFLYVLTDLDPAVPTSNISLGQLKARYK